MIRRVLAAGLPLILICLAPVSADADTWDGSDPTGDVIGMVWDEDATSCDYAEADATGESDADVVGLEVEHRSRRVVVTVDLQDLRAGRHVASSINLKMPGHIWTFLLERRVGHRATVTKIDFGHRAPTSTCVTIGVTPLGPEECRSITAGVSTAADRIRLRIPRDCLGKPRWVRAGAGVSVTRDDETYYYDRWGDDLTSWTGTLTPRVLLTR